MFFLADDALAGALDRVLSRRECAVAFAGSDVRGDRAAALLHCDWAVIAADASIAIDTPEAWSGAIWRIGRGALRLLTTSGTVSAEQALRDGLVDAVVAAGTDPLQWLNGWLAGRSEIALDSAAALIRLRGGDPLERAEFARMFGVGEPQIGLAAFLEKRKPQWSVKKHEPQHH